MNPTEEHKHRSRMMGPCRLQEILTQLLPVFVGLGTKSSRHERAGRSFDHSAETLARPPPCPLMDHTAETISSSPNRYTRLSDNGHASLGRVQISARPALGQGDLCMFNGCSLWGITSARAIKWYRGAELSTDSLVLYARPQHCTCLDDLTNVRIAFCLGLTLRVGVYFIPKLDKQHLPRIPEP